MTISMVVTNAVSLSRCYCKFVLATVSHNYGDILAQSKSTTRCAIRMQLLPIRSYTQRRNDGFDVVRATSTEAWQMFLIRVVRLVAMTRCPRYFRNSVFQNQFLLDGCSD